MAWIGLIIGFILIFFSPAETDAQNLKKINVRQLSAEQGLVHYGVTSIYQDEYGFIWIGSKDGLNRFDGRKNEIFRQTPDDPNDLTDNNVGTICGDGNGHLFVRGYATASVFDLKTYRFKMIRRTGVAAIHYANGYLWIASPKAISRYAPETGTLEQFFSFGENQTPDIHISAICVGKSGTLHVATVHHGYFRIRPDGEIVGHTPLEEANSMIEDEQGNVWIATRHQGLYRIDPSLRVRHYLHSADPRSLIHNNVRQIISVGDDKYYVCTMGGLSLLDASTDTFTHFSYGRQDEVYDTGSVTAMMYDRQGTLWFGTFYNGVYNYNPEYDLFRHYQPSKHVPGRLSSRIVNAVAEDRDGRIWMGTEGGGLNRLDPDSYVFTAYRSGGSNTISENIVKSLYYDTAANTLWASTLNRGINRLDLNTGKITHIPMKVRAGADSASDYKNILRITPLNADTLLLATDQGAVALDKRTLEFSLLEINYVSARRHQVWDILADSARVLWLTTASGLYQYDMDDRSTKRYAIRDVIGTNINMNFTRIMKDSKNRLWFGTAGAGLFLYLREQNGFKHYHTGDGLVNDYITGMCEDTASGKLLISTTGGLSRLDPQSGAFESFHRGNGFPFEAITEGSSYLTRGGELILGTLAGAVSMRSESLKKRYHNYDLSVSDIYVNNSRVIPGDSTRLLSTSTLSQHRISLRPGFNIISFEVFNNDFLNSFRSQFEYMLEGFDSHFSKASPNGQITYTNLSPGKYTFIARGTLPDADGNYPRTTMEVEVIPPFYDTVWFRLLCVLSIVGLLFYLIRAHIVRLKLRASVESVRREQEHLEEVNQMKLRFFTNVAHEFRTPLTLISGQLELALQKRDVNPSMYSGVLSAYKHTKRMWRLVDEIIDIRKQEQGFLKLKVAYQDMIPFIRTVYPGFEQIARKKKIAYTLQLPDEPVDLWFDALQMEKVLFNLLSNAFKYTPYGGTIELAVTNGPDCVSIRVTDNGAGIAPEHIAHVFERFYQDEKLNSGLQTMGSGIGLSFTKTVVEMHDGTITARSEPNVRTTFEVLLPHTDTFSNPNVEKVQSNPVAEIVTDYSPEEKNENKDRNTDGKRAKMVIVEDNEAVRELLTEIFGFIYDIFIAENGEQGIERVREIQPDIVLSDVVMPGITGSEMCYRLKNDPQTCHIPVVLLTARHAEQYMVEGLQTGADDYITKPFSVKLLIARCNNLVEGRRRLQQAFRKEIDSSVRTLTTNPLDQELLTRAECVIESRLVDSDFNIHSFAREMGMSRSSLFSKIKGLTGQSPNELILTIRLKHGARRLTAAPGDTIAHIAYDLGFGSPSYFIKCFRSVYGETPTRYRQRNLE